MAYMQHQGVTLQSLHRSPQQLCIEVHTIVRILWTEAAQLAPAVGSSLTIDLGNVLVGVSDSHVHVLWMDGWMGGEDTMTQTRPGHLPLARPSALTTGPPRCQAS